MKRLFAYLPLLLLLASCQVTVVEPRIDPRDRMTGHYSMEEYSNTYHDFTYYSVTISKAQYAQNEIRIANFYAADISIYAYVNGDRITIPFQSVNGYEIEGVGTYYSNGMDFTYTVKDTYENTRKDFCDTKAWME